jgi:hypothetical protein
MHRKSILRLARVFGCWVLVGLVFTCETVRARQSPCGVDFPVNVILPDGALVRKLSPETFIAHGKHGPIPVESVTIDTGARRVLFVVETGKSLPAAARRIQATVLSEIMSNARPEDSFALLTARGPRVAVDFSSSRDQLKGALEELGLPPGGKDQGGGVLDTLIEAADWFHQPQPGDSIVVMTMGIESPHRVSYSQVRDSLAVRLIRLFGFQLGQIIGGYYQTGISIAPNGSTMPSASIAPNRENVFALSHESGGTIFLENTQGGPWREYKLTDENLQGAKRSADQTYKAVIEYYRVRVESPPKDFVLELAEPVKSQLPQARIMYPKHFPECVP